MKFCKISLFFVLFALICSLSFTFAEDDAAPAVKRTALRRPVGGKPAAKTTTTAAPANYDEEGDYAEEQQEGEGGEETDGAEPSSSTTTSTEAAPKKVVGPVIRPFRSNDDFLNSLKRRQMDAKKHRSEKPTPKAHHAKPAASAAADNSDDGEESAPAAAAPVSKGFKGGNSALNRRKLSKPGKPEPVAADADDAAAEESAQQKEESPVKRPAHPRLTLRKRV